MNFITKIPLFHSNQYRPLKFVLEKSENKLVKAFYAVQSIPYRKSIRKTKKSITLSVEPQKPNILSKKLIDMTVVWLWLILEYIKEPLDIKVKKNPVPNQGWNIESSGVHQGTIEQLFCSLDHCKDFPYIFSLLTPTRRHITYTDDLRYIYIKEVNLGELDEKNLFSANDGSCSGEENEP